jgi:hypothetical protein
MRAHPILMNEVQQAARISGNGQGRQCEACLMHTLQRENDRRGQIGTASHRFGQDDLRGSLLLQSARSSDQGIKPAAEAPRRYFGHGDTAQGSLRGIDKVITLVIGDDCRRNSLYSEHLRYAQDQRRLASTQKAADYY